MIQLSSAGKRFGPKLLFENLQHEIIGFRAVDVYRHGIQLGDDRRLGKANTSEK